MNPTDHPQRTAVCSVWHAKLVRAAAGFPLRIAQERHQVNPIGPRNSHGKHGTQVTIAVAGPNPATTDHALSDAQEPSVGGGGPNIRSGGLAALGAHKALAAAADPPPPPQVLAPTPRKAPNNMATTTRFDLRALVREVFKTSQLTNDDELTKEVLSRIAEGDERSALEQALPFVVRMLVSRDQRPLTFPKPRAEDPDTETAPGGHQRVDPQGEAAAGSPIPYRPSRKVEAIRTHWQRQLEARVAVGHKTRKFFGDCTPMDLAFLAKQRRELASANLHAADYLDALTRLMGELGVETVRELPESAVTALGAA